VATIAVFKANLEIVYFRPQSFSGSLFILQFGTHTLVNIRQLFVAAPGKEEDEEEEERDRCGDEVNREN